MRNIYRNKVCKTLYGHLPKVLDPPLDPFAMRAKYFPAGAEPSDSLGVCRPTGLTALFAPDAEMDRRIQTQMAQANQTSVEPNTTSAADTDPTSQSSTSAASHGKSKKARKRNAASTANTASVANIPQVTVDSQPKEMLVSVQNKIAEIQGKTESMRGEIERVSKENERILKENESMHDESEEIHNENERIDKDLSSICKDLEAAARVKHTSDFEALREVTTSLVPLHLRVFLDLARKKVLEHLGHETWEELRASRSVLQLSDSIFNDLKQKQAGNTPTHSAKEDDIRHAVLTQSLEIHDRKCLASLFTYAYNGRSLRSYHGIYYTTNICTRTQMHLQMLLITVSSTQGSFATC
ncbi:hypothetical protein BD769DRAFT_805648 [Suillus cothurnatus]|nr:hypothetical protein BD769DRAFT_805648 [Suillus cothurnatus]